MAICNRGDNTSTKIFPEKIPKNRLYPQNRKKNFRKIFGKFGYILYINEMIWIFGDSYSANFDNDTHGQPIKDYVDYKGYVPNTFGILLSDRLGHKHFNLAVPGNNNDTIFEEVIKRAPSIKKDDIIIVGWTHNARFRLAYSEKEKTFTTMLPNSADYKVAIKDLTYNTINEILINRTSRAYFEEFKVRFDFINWLFRDNILIQWTHDDGNLLINPTDNKVFKLNFHKSKYNLIIEETEGKVNDRHYSETAHIHLADEFVRLIGNKALRLKNNSIDIKGLI